MAVRLFCDAGGLDSSATFESVPVSLTRPDVIATIDKREIGIEIRSLYSDECPGIGSPDRKRHGIYQSVVTECSNLYAKRNGGWLVARVNFVKNIDVSRLSGMKKQRAIAKKLVDLVEELHPVEGDHFDFRSEDHWGSQWPEEILGIHGVLLKGDGRPDWGYSDSCWISETSDKLIQMALDEKEKFIGGWRDRYDEAWALLVLDGSVGSSMLRPHKELNSSEFRSSFDRACLLDFTGKSFIDLRLRRS